MGLHAELTVRRQLDDDGIRAESVRDRAVVIAEVRRYGIQQGDGAHHPLGRVFLLHVERRIVRREIELAAGEAPHHRLRFWHGYGGALNLQANRRQMAVEIKKFARLSATPLLLLLLLLSAFPSAPSVNRRPTTRVPLPLPLSPPISSLSLFSAKRFGALAFKEKNAGERSVMQHGVGETRIGVSSRTSKEKSGREGGRGRSPPRPSHPPRASAERRIRVR